MKKPISIALVAACSLAGAAAQAQPQNIYARIDTGGSFSTNAGKDVAVDIGSSAIVGVGVGAKFLPFLRTDVTLSYRPATLSPPRRRPSSRQAPPAEATSRPSPLW